MPSREQFAYTFDNLARVIDEFAEKVGLTRYALDVQDYGAPVGYRLAAAHPERVTAIAVSRYCRRWDSNPHPLAETGF